MGPPLPESRVESATIKVYKHKLIATKKISIVYEDKFTIINFYFFLGEKDIPPSQMLRGDMGPEKKGYPRGGEWGLPQVRLETLIS